MDFGHIFAWLEVAEKSDQPETEGPVKLEALIRANRQIRTLGIDDAPFAPHRRGQVLVVGAIYSGHAFEGLVSCKVRQDGRNATRSLLRMIGGSKFQPQLHMIVLDGLTLAGFNIVDLPTLAGELGIPCAAVTRKPPDLDAVFAAAEHLPGHRWRHRMVSRAGPVYRSGPLYFQVAGTEPSTAGSVLQRCVKHGNLPECVRAAHLIARGIVLGQSGRRA